MLTGIRMHCKDKLRGVKKKYHPTQNQILLKSRNLGCSVKVMQFDTKRSTWITGVAAWCWSLVQRWKVKHRSSQFASRASADLHTFMLLDQTVPGRSRCFLVPPVNVIRSLYVNGVEHERISEMFSWTLQLIVFDHWWSLEKWHHGSDV